MKIMRHPNPEIGTFLAFDKDVGAMSREEMKGLLECILHRGGPGQDHAETVMRELEIAEEAAGLNCRYSSTCVGAVIAGGVR